MLVEWLVIACAWLAVCLVVACWVVAQQHKLAVDNAAVSDMHAQQANRLEQACLEWAADALRDTDTIAGLKAAVAKAEAAISTCEQAHAADVIKYSREVGELHRERDAAMPEIHDLNKDLMVAQNELACAKDGWRKACARLAEESSLVAAQAESIEILTIDLERMGKRLEQAHGKVIKKPAKRLA